MTVPAHETTAVERARRWAELWKAQATVERRYQRLLHARELGGKPTWSQVEDWPDERRCLFCKCFCHTGGEKHHYPVPDRFGGTETRLVCRSCHDKADRIPLSHFDPEHVERTWQALWDRAYPEERILLWKFMTGFWDLMRSGRK